MADYYVIPTNIGEAKMANALALGIPLEIIELALGDGEGNGARGTPEPNPEQTTLVSERRRAPLNSFAPDPENSNVLIAEQVIPETAGGFWIREMGLFDADGDLIFVANAPPTYKPQLAEGSGRTQVVRMAAIVSNTAAVTLKVDPSVVLATRAFTDQQMDEHQASRNHPPATTSDQGMVQLSTVEQTVAGESETAATHPRGVQTAIERFDLDRPFDRLIKGSVGSGIYNQWIEPVALSRMENGTPFVYVGHVEGATGNQKVTRINTISGAHETKTVYTGYPADDHNGVAIQETFDGKLLIACTGHNDDALVRYDTFDSWDSVGLLSLSLSFSGPTTYVQVQRFDSAIYVFTRPTVFKWAAKRSLDNGATWSNEFTVFEHTEQCYLITRKINRHRNSKGIVDGELLRFLIYPHPYSATTHEIRRGSINNEDGPDPTGANHFIVTSSSGDYRVVEQLESGSATPLGLTDFPVVYAPPANRSVRLWDIAESDDYMLLLSTFDLTEPYENADYKLIVGASAEQEIDLPISPGGDLPVFTYYPGAAFIRRPAPDMVSASGVEIIAASNPGDIDGVNTVTRLRWDGSAWTSKTIHRSADDYLVRPLGIAGGSANADVVLARVSSYGPSYTEFSGSIEILRGHVNEFRYEAPIDRTNVTRDGDAPWSIYLGGLVMQGGVVNVSGATSGTFPLEVPLSKILHVHYDDVASLGSPWGGIRTNGDYDGKTPPITAIAYEAEDNIQTARWMVIGVPA